ncbi:hypothetical protein BH23PLA1_BH23PLA1_32040 [soil metagenome]
MDFLIIGEGPEELAWARFLDDRPAHRLRAACPGFKSWPKLAGGVDLDAALATAGIEAVLVGGEPELRAEGLRRAAGVGLPCLVLHPPGDNADPYYQVALSRQETGAVVLPDLPGRLHPGLAALRGAIDGSAPGLGAFHELRYERPVSPEEGGLLSHVFPRDVDVVRDLLGEIHTVTAIGDPPGPRPTSGLIVQLRDARGRRAEVRLRAVGSSVLEPSRLSVVGSEGSLTLEYEPGFLGPSRLIRHPGEPSKSVTELPPWEARAAMLETFERAIQGQVVHPDLLDGTRALELAESTARSLRRGRTIDLHYEEVSEASNFKTIMTSLGCLLLAGILLLLPVALAGPALGIDATIYLAYIIPPVLVGFVLLQLLRLGIKDRSPTNPDSSDLDSLIAGRPPKP